MRTIHYVVLFCAAAALQSCGAPVVSNACEGLSHDEAVRMSLQARDELVSGTGANPRNASFAAAPITEVELGAQAEGYAAKVTFTDFNGRTIKTLIDTDCYIGWTGSDPNAYL